MLINFNVTKYKIMRQNHVILLLISFDILHPDFKSNTTQKIKFQFFKKIKYFFKKLSFSEKGKNYFLIWQKIIYELNNKEKDKKIRNLLTYLFNLYNS